MRHSSSSHFHKQDTLLDDIDTSLDIIHAPEIQHTIPEKIGPYPIHALLSKKGFSILYLASDVKTKKPLIIKVLPQKFQKDSSYIDRFLQEAKIIGKASHENIVQFYGQGQWEEGLYIAMEFVQGISLRSLIESASLSLKNAFSMGIQIAKALSHLHRHQIIHRDLKPENIMLTEEAKIKLIDFGIAFMTNAELVQAINHKAFMGTPAYMSPEQKKPPHHISFASDIYSLGIVIYELITGKLSHGQVNLKHLPNHARTILNQCIESDVALRYSKVEDFIRDATKYLQSPEIDKDSLSSFQQQQRIERTIQDNFKELFPPPPKWSKVDLGLVTEWSCELTGVLYDFIEPKPGIYAIFCAESLDKNIASVLHISELRGMIRAFSKDMKNPVKLAFDLNMSIMENKLEQRFKFCYLILNPSANQLKYLSCGFHDLIHICSEIGTAKQIHNENPPLGQAANSQFIDISHNWSAGDIVLLHSIPWTEETQSINNKEVEKYFLSTGEKTSYLSAQKQIEQIEHQFRHNFLPGNPLFTHTFMAIHRNP